jgi:hypothetical protein
MHQKKPIFKDPVKNKNVYPPSVTEDDYVGIYTVSEFKKMIYATEFWNIIENNEPEITRVDEDEKNINIYVSYISPENRKMILTVVVSIDKKFITVYKEDNTEKYLWGALGATTLYGIITTVILAL